MPTESKGPTARVSTRTIVTLIFVSPAAARASASARRPFVSQAKAAKTMAQTISGPITSANGLISRPRASVSCGGKNALHHAPSGAGAQDAQGSPNLRLMRQLARHAFEASHHPLPAVARPLEEGLVLRPEARLF